MGKGNADDAIRFANELHNLLELEFEALKLQKLSEIESIQEKKNTHFRISQRGFN